MPAVVTSQYSGQSPFEKLKDGFYTSAYATLESLTNGFVGHIDGVRKQMNLRKEVLDTDGGGLSGGTILQPYSIAITGQAPTEVGIPTFSDTAYPVVPFVVNEYFSYPNFFNDWQEFLYKGTATDPKELADILLKKHFALVGNRVFNNTEKMLWLGDTTNSQGTFPAYLKQIDGFIRIINSAISGGTFTGGQNTFVAASGINIGNVESYLQDISSYISTNYPQFVNNPNFKLIVSKPLKDLIDQASTLRNGLTGFTTVNPYALTNITDKTMANIRRSWYLGYEICESHALNFAPDGTIAGSGKWTVYGTISPSKMDLGQIYQGTDGNFILGTNFAPFNGTMQGSGIDQIFQFADDLVSNPRMREVPFVEAVQLRLVYYASVGIRSLSDVIVNSIVAS